MKTAGKCCGELSIWESPILNGIPADSRAAGSSVFLKPEDITELKMVKVKELNEIARSRGQSLAQMALAWILRGGE